jgi:hypothetical protein
MTEIIIDDVALLAKVLGWQDGYDSVMEKYEYEAEALFRD